MKKVAEERFVDSPYVKWMNLRKNHFQYGFYNDFNSSYFPKGIIWNSMPLGDYHIDFSSLRYVTCISLVEFLVRPYTC